MAYLWMRKHVFMDAESMAGGAEAYTTAGQQQVLEAAHCAGL